MNSSLISPHTALTWKSNHIYLLRRSTLQHSSPEPAETRKGTVSTSNHSADLRSPPPSRHHAKLHVRSTSITKSFITRIHTTHINHLPVSCLVDVPCQSTYLFSSSVWSSRPVFPSLHPSSVSSFINVLKLLECLGLLPVYSLKTEKLYCMFYFKYMCLNVWLMNSLLHFTFLLSMIFFVCVFPLFPF